MSEREKMMIEFTLKTMRDHEVCLKALLYSMHTNYNIIFSQTEGEL